jgi:hypothetical protein
MLMMDHSSNGIAATTAHANYLDTGYGHTTVTLLSGNQQAINLARQAAAINHCQLPYLGQPDQPLVFLDAPALPGIRYLIDLAAVQARFLAASGQQDQAAQEVLAMLQMACHLARGVTLQEALVAAAGADQATALLRDLALGHKLSPDVLAHTLTRLDKLAPALPNLRRAVAADQVIALDLFDTMFR